MVVPGLILAPKAPGAHMGLVGLGAGLLFPLSMYISFTGSLKSGRPRSGFEAVVPVVAVVLAASSLAAYLLGLRYRVLAGMAMAALVLHAFMQVRGWRRREPWQVLLYPPLAGALFSACDCGLVEWMLGLGVFYASSMVMVVSLFTVSRNYGVDPSRPLVWAPLAVNAVALGILYYGGPWVLVAALSLLLYFVVLRVYRAPSLIARGLSIGGPGGGALVYMASSHTASVAPTLLLFYPGFDLLSKLHLAYIGFVGVHIFLHAPLMLPQIVRVKLAKDYTPLPTVLLSMAALARPWNGDLAYILVVASLAVLATQFRPLGLIRSRV